MQKTFVTYLLYQHSQYAAFDRPNKTEVIIVTLGKSVTMGDLKISKTDVEVQWLDRDQRKLKKKKHSAVIPACSAKSERLYCD